MSSIMISSLIFLLFLLCHFMHACEGRRIGVVKEISKHVHHHSSKGIEKAINDQEIPKVKTYSKKKLKRKPRHRKATITSSSPSVGSVVLNGKSDGDGTIAHQNQNQDALLKEDQEKKEITQGDDNTKSFVSFSWRVPKKKPKEQPGFSLDYAPPKTHPPSHN